MKRILSVILCLFAISSVAQTYVPTCPSNLVYLHNSPIQVYNPSLPIGAGNPSSTGIPSGGSGLALMPNINAPTPSPTFYTTIGGNVAWWNGSSWVNTGHSTGNSAAVNLGGGGCYLYNLVGSTGQVYVYNGTGPATLLVTLSGFSGGGPYDICCDANGNWYILKTTTPQTMTMYSPTGAVLATYNMTGMPSTSAGGGFAIVGNQVYVSNSSGFFTGTISGSTISFTNNSSVSGTMSAGDYASCPTAGTIASFTAVAVTNGTLGCSTTSVNLSASTNLSPVNSYSWTGPGLVGSATGSTAVANAAGVYSCTITKTVCPMSQTVVTTTVTSNGTTINPSLTVTNTLTCSNPSAQISVVPGPTGYTYAWTGPGITSATNIPTITVNQPGTYSVSVTSTTNTCQGSQTVSVVSNTVPPIVTATPSGTAICFGQSTGFTAAGAITYTWNTGSTSAAITVTPNTTSSYTVIGSAANGCTNSAVSTVTVIPLPTPIANSNNPICDGGNLLLNVSAGATYVWTGPNGFNSAVQNPSISPVTVAASGIYSVTVLVGTCSGSTTTSVLINPLPTPNATNNGPVCEGVGLTFNGSGGVFYNWSGPLGFSSNAQAPGILVPSVTNSGVYTVTVTDANGCTNFTTTTVLINPLPAISISGSTVCANQTINLSSSGGTTYNWTGPNGFSSNQQNPSIANATPAMAGMYNLTVTDVNNCSSSTNTIVVVNPIPTPNASNNSPICEGDVLNFTSNGGITYQWSGPNGFSSIGQTPVISPAFANNSGSYTVTVSDNIGCSASAVTSVIVNPLPVPAIVSSANNGCVPLCVTFTCSNSSSLQSVVWSVNGGNGSSGSTYANCFYNSGTYSVNANVVDVNGCKNAVTYLIDAYPIPVADFNFSPLKPIINTDAVNFTDATHEATVQTWNWYFYGTASNTSNVQNPSFYYPEAGTYPVTLVVKSDHGCFDTITKVIVVGEDFGIYVPDAFTPNNDGLNDVFQPKGFGVTKYQLQIFDRWGERIFETKTFEQGWDGHFKSKGLDYEKVCEEGVYTWLINVTSVFGKAQELKGHVTLIK